MSQLLVMLTELISLPTNSQFHVYGYVYGYVPHGEVGP